MDGRCATRAQRVHTCTNVRFGRGLSTAMKRVRRCALESPGLSTPSGPWGTAAEKATCRWPANQYRGFIACRQALVLQGQVRGLVHVGVLSLGEWLTGSPPACCGRLAALIHNDMCEGCLVLGRTCAALHRAWPQVRVAPLRRLLTGGPGTDDARQAVLESIALARQVRKAQ